MSPILSNILNEWLDASLWLVGFFIAFGLLARWTPCNAGQPLWRKGMVTDILYSFAIPLLNRFAHVIFFGVFIAIFFRATDQDTLGDYIRHGFGPLSAWPLWAQAACVFILSDIILYWFHRLFHGKTLWPFHAIHHSSPEVDWLSTYRFHPINTWFAFVLTNVMMLAVGFSPEAIAIMAVFNMIYSAMVHANLNWTFGPFKYVFASPVFHRWHHTFEKEGMNKNFAPTFPLIDIIFGTFYMPEGKLPQHFGVPGSGIPSGFLGQMAWPFKQRP